MLDVPAYTHERRPYSGTLYPTSFTLTLSLPSRLAPHATLTVDVPTRALLLAGIFLRRKKICAGVVGTRTDWVPKGEEGGMTTPMLQYVARFDGGGGFLGLEGEVTRRVGHGAPCLSYSRLYSLRQAARNQLYPSCAGTGQACLPFPAFSSPCFYLGRTL